MGLLAGIREKSKASVVVKVVGRKSTLWENVRNFCLPITNFCCLPITMLYELNLSEPLVFGCVKTCVIG